MSKYKITKVWGEHGEQTLSYNGDIKEWLLKFHCTSNVDYCYNQLEDFGSIDVQIGINENWNSPKSIYEIKKEVNQ